MPLVLMKKIASAVLFRAGMNKKGLAIIQKTAVMRCLYFHFHLVEVVVYDLDMHRHVRRNESGYLPMDSVQCILFCPLLVSVYQQLRLYRQAWQSPSRKTVLFFKSHIT